jgi:hypothetical protein
MLFPDSNGEHEDGGPMDVSIMFKEVTRNLHAAQRTGCRVGARARGAAGGCARAHPRRGDPGAARARGVLSWLLCEGGAVPDGPSL